MILADVLMELSGKKQADFNIQIFMGKLIKSFGFLITAVLIIAGFSACGSVNTNAGTSKIQIVTTLFPLYDFAKNIGGEKGDVTLLLPPGVEAHSFEPKPSDIVRISQTDVFVYTGKFMEPWVEDVLNGVSNKNLIVVDSSKNIQMIPGVFHDSDEPPGSLDPHIWLDFGNAKIMVDNIKDALIERDPANKSFYEKNAADYKLKMDNLDQAYKKGLSSCKIHEIIYAGHYAFGYLAKRYGLDYIAAQGISPDSEPTPVQMIQMVEQIRALKAKYIFYEELVQPTIADTLAQETGVKMLKLSAAHNLTRDDFENGLSFFSIMENNLSTLKQGLECV
jgi:zinc transport system substrate-binding protein